MNWVRVRRREVDGVEYSMSRADQLIEFVVGRHAFAVEGEATVFRVELGDFR